MQLKQEELNPTLGANVSGITTGALRLLTI